MLKILSGLPRRPSICLWMKMKAWKMIEIMTMKKTSLRKVMLRQMMLAARLIQKTKSRKVLEKVSCIHESWSTVASRVRLPVDPDWTNPNWVQVSWITLLLAISSGVSEAENPNLPTGEDFIPTQRKTCHSRI